MPTRCKRLWHCVEDTQLKTGRPGAWLCGAWEVSLNSLLLALSAPTQPPSWMLSPAVSMTALSSVCSQRALWIFEMPMGVPLRQHFNSSFRNSFGSYAGLKGPMLILRMASMMPRLQLGPPLPHQWHDGGQDVRHHSVHAAFYTSGGLVHRSHLQAHLPRNVHAHLAHYRTDLDAAGGT